MKVICFSDIHIGDPQFVAIKEFRSFIIWASHYADKLFCVGDLFDLWRDYEIKILFEYFDVVSVIRRSIIRLGNYIIGNHDYSARHLTVLPGIYYPNYRGTINNKEYYISHGHLEYGFMSDLFLKISENHFFTAIFSKVSRNEQTLNIYQKMLNVIVNSRRGNDNSRLKTFANRYDADVFIFGHTHFPELCNLGDGKVFLNCGDWITHRTFVLIEDNKFSLVDWNNGKKIVINQIYS